MHGKTRTELRIAAVCMALLAASCTAPPPAPPIPEGAPPGFPAERYRQADAAGRLYAVDAEASLATARVYRGGALANMGHDHVVAARDIAGFLRLPQDGGAAVGDLYVALGRLTVDEASLRRQAGFASEPSAADVEATRGNMLKSVDAARYPFLELSVTAELEAPVRGRTEVLADLRVRLHGRERSYAVPVTLTATAARLEAAGDFSIEQSDFGIEPFSVLGGALRVRDRVDIRFDLVAERWQGGGGR